jgi:trigger factor
MTEDEAEASEDPRRQEADFEFSLSYEVIPTIELKDNSGIKVTREVVEVDEEVDEQIGRDRRKRRPTRPRRARPRTATASPSITSARSTAKPSTAARTRTPNS